LLRGPDVVASVASLWELCIKAGKRNALVNSPVSWWARHITQSGIDTLPIKESHVIALASIAAIHKDPFDRIMVAQAMVEKLPLITRDGHLSQYGIQTIW
jgi:PIN domain nuclease of toxin-antitoxin system